MVCVQGCLRTVFVFFCLELFLVRCGFVLRLVVVARIAVVGL